MSILTFDIETLKWDEPIAVGFYDGFNYVDFLKMKETDDVIWEFLTHIRDNCGSCKVYAHNAAYFDNRFILDSLIKHRQRVSIESGLGVLRWIEARISFHDTYQLLRTSLEKACTIFGVEEKLKWDHDSTKSIAKMGRNERRVFRAYLERDCRSLSKVYEKFVWKLMDTFKIGEPGQTLAQTSLRVFDTFHPLEGIEGNDEHHVQIRSALYGARNEIYRRYGEDLHLYDIRSMYVSCYDTEVPTGKLQFVNPRMDTGVLGRAEVEVPETLFIPPLPLHYEGRLIFPVGKFEGWWDMRELRYAESLGCKIKLKAQLEGEETPLLKDFGELICQLRLTSEKGLSRLWKMLGLQLVGKFAQSRSRTSIKHVSTILDLENCTPIDENEEYYEVERKLTAPLIRYISKVTKPAITMRIRAEARIRHHKILLGALENGEVYYCDTDSVYCQAILSTGINAGELQDLGEALRAYFIMNKFYAWVDLKGTLRQRSSGFSGLRLGEDAFKRILEGKVLRLRSSSPNLTSTSDIINGNGLVASPRFRTIRTPLNQQNRIFDGNETKPIKLG